MSNNFYKFKAKLWLTNGPTVWHFISLPKKMSVEIKQTFGDMARGWGSLPVRVRIKNTGWVTSIFPDKKLATYLLPLKSAVRKRANINSTDEVLVTLHILV